MTIMYKLTPPTCIYSLSLHDALPILIASAKLFKVRFKVDMMRSPPGRTSAQAVATNAAWSGTCSITSIARTARSEEHTSELQSQSNLVCRLLLEKKKQGTIPQHYEVL